MRLDVGGPAVWARFDQELGMRHGRVFDVDGRGLVAVHDFGREIEVGELRGEARERGLLPLDEVRVVVERATGHGLVHAKEQDATMRRQGLGRVQHARASARWSAWYSPGKNV